MYYHEKCSLPLPEWAALCCVNVLEKTRDYLIEVKIMESGKRFTLIKILKMLVLALFVIAVILIGVYPAKNQAITMIIDTTEGRQSVTFDPDEIREMTEFEVSFEQFKDAAIKEIRIYRYFKTICVDKITSDHIYNYAELIDHSVKFNNNTSELLRKLSKSFLLERLIFAEGMLAAALFLWIMMNALGEKLILNNRNNHGPVKEIGRFIHDVRKYRQYMNFAAKADLKAEVANSYLNRLWWLLEPLFNMLVYVIVFGKLMGSSVQNYSTFVFSALLMWNFFSKTINYSVKCVRNNRDIVTKVYVPKHVLLISNMILNFYKLLFSLIVLIPMLVIFRVHIGLGALWLVSAYILMLILSFGIGMFFLHYGVYIDDLGYAVGILLQMLMFLSGVFYDAVTGLSAPLNILMLVLNPVSMFIDTMRNALLYNVISNVPLIVVWVILSLLVSYMGIHLVYKNENGYVKVV